MEIDFGERVDQYEEHSEDLGQSNTIANLCHPEPKVINELHESDQASDCGENEDLTYIDSHHGMFLDTCLQPVDIAQVLNQNFDSVLCVAPAEANNPIRLLQDTTNEDKCFPVLFPTGSPTFHDDRKVKTTINADDEVVPFIDQYVTCDLPSPEDTELYDIVNTVQKHSSRHSKTCRKKNTVCRFNFPRPPSCRTYVTRPVAAKNTLTKSSTMTTDVDMESETANRIPKLSEKWAYYLTAHKKKQKLATLTLRNRSKNLVVYTFTTEVSAQEAVYRLTGMHLKECSRKVTFVPTGEHPLRMSLPLAVLKETLIPLINLACG